MALNRATLWSEHSRRSPYALWEYVTYYYVARYIRNSKYLEGRPLPVIVNAMHECEEVDGVDGSPDQLDYPAFGHTRQRERGHEQEMPGHPIGVFDAVRRLRSRREDDDKTRVAKTHPAVPPSPRPRPTPSARPAAFWPPSSPSASVCDGGELGPHLPLGLVGLKWPPPLPPPRSRCRPRQRRTPNPPPRTCLSSDRSIERRERFAK